MYNCVFFSIFLSSIIIKNWFHIHHESDPYDDSRLLLFSVWGAKWDTGKFFHFIMFFVPKVNLKIIFTSLWFSFFESLSERKKCPHVHRVTSFQSCRCLRENEFLELSKRSLMISRTAATALEHIADAFSMVFFSYHQNYTKNFNSNCESVRPWRLLKAQRVVIDAQSTTTIISFIFLLLHLHFA